MSLPAVLHDRLRLPVIVSPMFLVSGPALVTPKTARATGWPASWNRRCGTS